MIRKYARIDAKPETVRTIFHEVEQWQSWMPSIEAVEILERSAERALVVVRQRLRGRLSTQKLDLRFDDEGYTETQISGRLKRWRAVWRFAEPPTGKGTVVSTEVDISLGMARYFVPRRIVQRMIDDLHENIVARAEARAKRREAMTMATIWGVLPGQKLAIRVYETPTELEVWLGNRRFVVPAAE